MPKERKRGATTGGATRHAPLGQVMTDDANKSKYATVKSRDKKSSGKKDKYVDGDLLNEKETRRIFELSKEQMLEVEIEEQQQVEKNRRGGRKNVDEDSSDEEDNGSTMGDILQDGTDDLVQHDAGYVTVVEGAPGLSPEEEAVVAAMMGGDKKERRTLADIIMDKIQEKEMQQQKVIGEEEEDEDGFTELPPKVAQVYTDIGKILAKYTAGKLPKAFKVIPSLTNWEEVLYLTRPDQWTPQAMFAATRIFASNLNPKMAQRFYNLVLLDAVRADIVETQKLNYHYFRSLKKAVYKPAAFFKGILLPLVKSNCTLREAAIVASVLQRESIPVHHSAVAIHKLAQMEYTGGASIFIKTLLNKKYSLPAPVITSVVRHFVAFTHNEKVELPVLWHQSLLVFVQRYKNDLQTEARESLRLLMKKHFHHKITPEIRRELFGQQAYKEERAAIAAMAMET
uniref:Bystin n=1 Tax=Chaetoceros debilis TaxID=122233 RepID=A0A7S3PYJ4_9STRA|mmetsp:Transcript_18761/g.28507  ORF Transcript_18761/g.28507 Transcript_18761/m.28507 type:complete len:455 (-) Transcript_18761:57-1421(-)|eukprot:CAMPEP_0194078870 /NCGR_PEP_ID=MMETSP0149-20130528/5165_1 /TAXON_ID=122233 /ORGANISM="Chaetoceros debilis, Strain MM31A-1" /LENGTH=454 /DNA_ID=CAMNT_0038760203 /DNA_START=82 /DNA_END=1446 /DNA_ORIENTATION=-